jgi:hypothetical protein
VLASVEPGRGMTAPPGAVVVLRRPAIVRLAGSLPMDVAWCAGARTGEGEETFRVRRVGCFGGRVPVAPGLWTPIVIVAGGGSFERWRLRPGDELVIAGD